MTEYAILAFGITPAVVIGLAYAALRWHEHVARLTIEKIAAEKRQSMISDMIGRPGS